jgi:soluble lytic murein transglycosylase-like protein
MTFRPILALAAIPLFGAEFAVLETGFRVRAERTERQGTIVRLHTADGGVIEMEADRIVRFEADDTPVVMVAPPPVAAPVEPVVQKLRTTRDLIDQAAAKNGLPPAFVHSVVAQESAYRPDAVSHKGAIGLMQLMPATAKAQGVTDPRDPEQNVEAGARILRELLVKYNGDTHRALAAYNAGEGAVARYGGVPPYRETVNYVDKVVRRYLQATGGEGQR